MENATLQPLSPNAIAAQEPPGFVQRLGALPLGRKLALGGGLVALVLIVAALAFQGQKADYKVLFANLSDKDGGAILAQLSQMNVPYKHADGGAAILVPADKVHDVRLKLAQAGLPKGGTVGFELMDTARFGTTQFQERLNFQRGLEGELVRSITALAQVQGARVHLALPQQNGFFREQQKPSASVLLTLHPGRTLDRAQVAGIVHLVSSSVPELNPKAVSVLDQTGALLSGPAEGLQDANGLDAQQLAYVRNIEAMHTRRIMDMLEPVLGRDNLRAQVTADVDFTQTEATSEEFRPNQGQEPAAVRSAQLLESTGPGVVPPSGVPGAATNQPPVPATAPITGASAPLQAANAGAAQGGGSRKEQVTNYEVDKTVRVVRGATGVVKRLNAAVVVNYRNVTDPKGKSSVQPLPKEELDKLTALVQETVGFDAKRGDSVRVVNAPFQEVKPPVDDAPFWKKPETLEIVRTLAMPVALALVALGVIFGAIRPAINAAKPLPPPEPEKPLVDAVVDDANLLPGAEGADGAPGTELAALEAPKDPAQARLEEARQFARDNPAAVANILRTWVNKDE